MYNINFTNIKKGRRFYYVFLAAGLFFLSILASIYISTIVSKNTLDSSTISTRVSVRQHTSSRSSANMLYSPVYYFEVNGEEYICPSTSSSSIYPGTENKTVYYNSKNPEECMTEYTISSNTTLLFAIILPLIFIVFSLIKIHKVNQRIGKIKELNQKGRLIKDLPYTLENTGMSVNHKPVKRIVVEYTLPSGSKITLQGDPIFDDKIADADGYVDLVIDESDPSNYYIDFDIDYSTQGPTTTAN